MSNILEQTSKAIHETKIHGSYEISVFVNHDTKQEHLVLSKGLDTSDPIYCRVFSECSTGIILNSNNCDCKEQLDFALNYFNQIKSAILIFLREEGRGHGLTLKIQALANKNKGYDTFKAVEALGIASDLRTYKEATEILKHKNITQIHLLTNNPDKILAIENGGIEVKSIINIPVTKDIHTAIHLEAKIKRGHNIKFI